MILPPAFDDLMRRDKLVVTEDADHVGRLMHLKEASGAIRYAVVVASDRDDTFVADAALQVKERVEGQSRAFRSNCSAAKASGTIFPRRRVQPMRRSLSVAAT